MKSTLLENNEHDDTEDHGSNDHTDGHDKEKKDRKPKPNDTMSERQEQQDHIELHEMD